MKLYEPLQMAIVIPAAIVLWTIAAILMLAAFAYDLLFPRR